MNDYLTLRAVAKRMGLRVTEARDHLRAAHGLDPDAQDRYDRAAIDAALSPKARVPKPGQALPAVAPPKRKAIDFEPDGTLRGRVTLKQITKRMGLRPEQIETARQRLKAAKIGPIEKAAGGKPRLYDAEAVERLIAEAPWSKAKARASAPAPPAAAPWDRPLPKKAAEAMQGDELDRAIGILEAARARARATVETAREYLADAESELEKYAKALDALRGPA